MATNCLFILLSYVFTKTLVSESKVFTSVQDIKLFISSQRSFIIRTWKFYFGRTGQN